MPPRGRSPAQANRLRLAGVGGPTLLRTGPRASRLLVPLPAGRWAALRQPEWCPRPQQIAFHSCRQIYLISSMFSHREPFVTPLPVGTTPWRSVSPLLQGVQPPPPTVSPPRRLGIRRLRSARTAARRAPAQPLLAL